MRYVNAVLDAKASINNAKRGIDMGEDKKDSYIAALVSNNIYNITTRSIFLLPMVMIT